MYEKDSKSIRHITIHNAFIYCVLYLVPATPCRGALPLEEDVHKWGRQGCCGHECLECDLPDLSTWLPLWMGFHQVLKQLSSINGLLPLVSIIVAVHNGGLLRLSPMPSLVLI